MSIPTDHPDAHRLAAYRTGLLSDAEILEVSDHLAGCPACRAALPAGGVDLAADVRRDLLTVPPDYEEMTALLEGTLDDAQSADVRARLTASPEAGAAFAALQQFHDEIAALPPKRHGPSLPPEPSLLPSPMSLPGRRAVVPFHGLPRGLWMAAAAVVLLAAGWWISAHPYPKTPPPLWADADLSRLPDDLRRAVEQAARTGTLDPPSIPADLHPQHGTLAGSAPKPTTLRQISPVGMVVREDQPALQWTAVEGTTGYVVYLLDVEERHPMQRQELSDTTTTWTPSEPLARGATYEWQVDALRGNDEILAHAPRPPEPEARFQVLDARHAAELAEIERLYPRNALILGTAYAQAGLTQAAEQQFETLAHLYPESETAKRLLQTTRGNK